MHVTYKLLFNKSFRSFIAVHAIYSLAKGISISILPLFVAKKFNTGDMLVISMSLRLLPTIVCTPILANVLARIGFKRLALIAMIWLAIVQLILPHISNSILFESLILLTGIIDTIIVASLLALRSQVIPVGKNISANAVLSIIESISRIVGPGLTIVMLWKLPLLQSFYSIALLLLIAALLLMCTYIPFEKSSSLHVKTVHYSSFLKIFYKKPILWYIYIPSLGYAILVGTRNLFLFWSNKDVFQNVESQWSLLLTLHGCGAILGSIIGQKVLNWINNKISLVETFLYLGLLRSIGYLTLAWVSNFNIALVTLATIGIPEILETICFFTLIQKYLEGKEKDIFYMLNIPIYYSFVILGTLSGKLYTTGMTTLKTFWILTSIVSAMVTLPFLLNARKANKNLACKN
jgi:predicted MFS family arabinose efflux permease